MNHLIRDGEPAKRLMTIPGIDAITATALLASVGNPKQFKNGCQFVAWLGLTLRQYTTGGKIRLRRIAKKGDAYLRTLLIHGTRRCCPPLGTSRMAQYLDQDPDRTPGLQARGRGVGGQECPHRLGDDGPGRDVSTENRGLNTA